ncbi:unnamed protein product [Closterium sp. NIES-65]|nr:unnamed protein product [Closterium sp. NIES-65]
MSGTGSRSSGTSTPHSSPPPLPTLPLLPSPPSFHLPLPSYPPSLGLRAQVRVELGGGGVESSTGYSETQQGGSLCCVESPRWVSKVIRKKHASSVTSVAWHPNNLLLATTCTDNKCRIFSATIKGVDSKSSESSSSGGFSGKFGEQLLQLDLAFGWTFGARWSPSGANLAFVGHDSTIHFINDVGPSLTLHSISLRYLPLRDVLFLSDRLLVAAGFDYNPILFSADANGTWTFVRVLDGSEEPTSTATGAALSAVTPLPPSPSLSSAYSLFSESWKTVLLFCVYLHFNVLLLAFPRCIPFVCYLTSTMIPPLAPQKDMFVLSSPIIPPAPEKDTFGRSMEQGNPLRSSLSDAAPNASLRHLKIPLSFPMTPSPAPQKDTFGRSMERGNSLRSGLTDAAPNTPSIPDSEFF